MHATNSVFLSTEVSWTSFVVLSNYLNCNLQCVYPNNHETIFELKFEPIVFVLSLGDRIYASEKRLTKSTQMLHILFVLDDSKHVNSVEYFGQGPKAPKIFNHNHKILIGSWCQRHYLGRVAY